MMIKLLKYLSAVVLTVGLAFNAEACLDPVTNFAIVTVSIGYDGSATSVVLNGSEGAKLPVTSTCANPNFGYNGTWYNDTDYPGNPSGDPNVEIVRVTARSTDTLTVTRAQEGTSATTKNTSGKTYKIIFGLTKNTYDQLDLYSTPYEAWWEYASDFPCQTVASCSTLNSFGSTGSGTLGPFNDTVINSAWALTTGAVLSQTRSEWIQGNDSTNTGRSQAMETTPSYFKTRIATGTTGTTNKLEVFGFLSATTITMAYQSTGNATCICFRVDETVGGGANAHVFSLVKNGVSTETTRDTGNFDSATFHTYEITATTTSVCFYVDGILVNSACETTNIPTAALIPTLGLFTIDSLSKVMAVDWIKLKLPRS